MFFADQSNDSFIRDYGNLTVDVNWRNMTDFSNICTFIALKVFDKYHSLFFEKKNQSVIMKFYFSFKVMLLISDT